ncbi:hypothetical protein E4191_11080 [Paracoccus liaowanqingii]|uniref:Uncharacterized protein n=1 Tax=Paracoccus liaowanqingii TaxID=2560053 RepID=A0A4P7HP65_9RHOB|nr:DUF4200 domain-containing protein [Paracoccus liaowanqingii]QBX35177.1 hypothetical protein E4191_11080 [Paracoccus liaowanqingii]
MNYFHGQLICERDLRTEQTYFREKLKHAHRCVYGYGILCGMVVHPVAPPEECLPDDSARRKELRAQIARLKEELTALKEKAREAQDEKEIKEIDARIDAVAAEREKLLQELDRLNGDRPDQSDDPCEKDSPPLHLVRVTCGAAIDCNGNDVILAGDRIVDVMALLKSSEREQLADGAPHRLYLSLCYEECGREPTRPFAMDDCATTNACQMARVAEGARIIASLTAPVDDRRCEPCCTCCDEACLLLAAIEVVKDEPIGGADIDHSVRRRFGLYDPTVITGISWAHGATYSARTANAILGTKDKDGGIEITFSRPVHVATITPGTVELMRITGGRGLSGVIAAMEGEFVDLPADGMVDRIRYRDATGETVQQKDRIMIVVRAPFLLDRCCRPLEGLHVGGRVPRLRIENAADEAARKEEAEAGLPHREVCNHPPHGPMPWTTSGPGNFESWFWIAGE